MMVPSQRFGRTGDDSPFLNFGAAAGAASKNKIGENTPKPSKDGIKLTLTNAAVKEMEDNNDEEFSVSCTLTDSVTVS
jgi:hypothetical protein